MCRGLLVSFLTMCVGSNGEIRKATNLLASPKHCLNVVLGHLLSGSLRMPEIELAARSDCAVYRKKQNLHVRKKSLRRIIDNILQKVILLSRDES